MKKVKPESMKKKKVNKNLKRKLVSKKSKPKNILTKLKYQVITILFILLSYFSGFT